MITVALELTANKWYDKVHFDLKYMYPNDLQKLYSNVDSMLLKTYWEYREVKNIGNVIKNKSA